MMHGVTGTTLFQPARQPKRSASIRAANAATGVISIPIIVPSNSIALKGSKLKSVEVDYELTDDVAVSVTAVLNKVVRAADGTAPTVTTPAVTQDLAAGVAAVTLDHHKMIVTVTTPEWVDHETYYLLQMSFECGAAVEVDVQSAVANFTLRM